MANERVNRSPLSAREGKVTILRSPLRNGKQPEDIAI